MRGLGGEGDSASRDQWSPPPSPTPPCSSIGLVHGQCQGVWGGVGVLWERCDICTECRARLSPQRGGGGGFLSCLRVPLEHCCAFTFLPWPPVLHPKSLN